MSEEDWIDIDFDVPVDDRYVLVSFSNFSVPSIGCMWKVMTEGESFTAETQRPAISQKG